MNFVQLHLHTYYSLLDGVNSPEEYVEKARKVGMKALAITDHGTMSGVLRFSNACRKAGIRGILGCEFYINDKRETEEGKKSNEHIILLAKNKIGYKNLLRINYDSFDKGFYYKGRTTTETIFRNRKGLICLTACMANPIAKLILENEIGKAEDVFLKWKYFFGDDFYGELQFNEIKNQRKVTLGIYRLCKKHRVKFIVAGDCHYINKEGAKLQDYLLMINQKKKISDDNIFRFDARNLYFHLPKDIFRLSKGYGISKVELQKAIANTVKVADKCNFMLGDEKSKFPAFFDKNGDKVNSDVVLLGKCVEALGKKFPESYPNDKYRERLNREIRVITDKNYSDYFLIVQDIVNFCKKNDIAVGPGRGSAAGSLVSYLLGITKVDPIRFDLLFERFLNKERDDAPDIDLDFENDRKKEVEEYLKQKYGKDRVAHTITFSTLRIKGALRDMARVLEKEKDDDFKTIIKKIEDNPIGVSYKLMKQIIDRENEWTVSERKYINRNKEMFELADKLTGRIRQFSQHAAGIAITPGPIYDYIPVYKIKGEIVTAFKEGKDFRELTQLGILKIDILGLENVSILKKAGKMIKDDLGLVIDLDNVDLYINDKRLYEILREEDCIGIFQFEHKGINNFLREVQPKNFEELASINALYRPAIVNAGEHIKYIRRKKKLEQLGKKFSEHYKAPVFGEILDRTYGTIVYQEQFIEILHKVGKFSLEEADKARKIFKDLYLRNQSTETKKADPGLVNIMVKFKRGAKRTTGMSDYNLEKFIAKLADFAEYSFNRSHAVSYAIIAMQTLYMREYYPLYFYTALLNTVENKEIVKDFRPENKMKTYMNYIRKRMGSSWDFNKIDIQKSTDKFYIEDSRIRVPLSVVRGVGSSLPLEIKKIIPIVSFSDFCIKELKIKSNRVAIMNLIDIGAFDSINKHRRALCKFWIEWSKIKSRYKDKSFLEVKKILFKLWQRHKDERDYTEAEQRQKEREICNFNMFCSDSILVLRKIDYILKKGKIVSLNEFTNKDQFYCFKVISKKLIYDKNKNKMAFLIGQDWLNNETEITVFSNIYEKFEKLFDMMESNLEDYYIVQGYKDDKGRIIVGAKNRNELNDKPIRMLKKLLNNRIF